jgi:uncharacterized protein YbbK (DUF523 family)
MQNGIGAICIGRKAIYLVSACLLGEACRYNGSAASVPLPLNILEAVEVIPICPECLGGLAIPRPPAEIVGGDGEDVLAGTAQIIDSEGRNRTEPFLLGAAKVLEMAEVHGVKGAILKARSPSCGQGKIYDGTFSNRLIDGDGVLTALLKKHGIQVWTEETWRGSQLPSLD